MILRESIFSDGKVVGILRQDTNTGQIAFSPNFSESRLTEKEWLDIDELKAAVKAAYAVEPGHG